SEVRPPLGVVLVPTDLQRNRPAFHIPEGVQPLPEGLHPRLRRDAWREDAEAGHLPPWLRLGGKRRDEQTQNERDDAPNGTTPHGYLLQLASCQPASFHGAEQPFHRNFFLDKIL